MSRAQLRIAGGTLKGRRLEVPSGVRPTESRVREALISIWRPALVDARVLDLFAGSGAVGLEALSQGALEVVFVEQSPRVAAALAKNCAGLGPGSFEIVRGRLPGVLERRPEGVFDLVFADPPYDWPGYTALVEAAASRAAPDGEVVIEHSSRIQLVPEVGRWLRHDRRRYGESCLSFYRRLGQEDFNDLHLARERLRNPNRRWTQEELERELDPRREERFRRVPGPARGVRRSPRQRGGCRGH